MNTPNLEALFIWMKKESVILENDTVSKAWHEYQELKKRKIEHKHSPASIDEFVTYGSTIGLPQEESERCFDFYESNGWKVGKNPMRSWQAAMRNWKRTLVERGGFVPITNSQSW